MKAPKKPETTTVLSDRDRVNIKATAARLRDMGRDLHWMATQMSNLALSLDGILNPQKPDVPDKDKP